MWGQAAVICPSMYGLIGGIRFAGAAPDATARITFVLVNDIYLMADELMSDGQRRGGFARLAAVVKAERAKASVTSGHVIFAHGGDTLSPSLMSGIDHGKHIMTLTNLIPPDIFVPGNHEFDFGKATFLQRMAEAKFPLYAANLRGPNRQPLPDFKDRSIVTVDGVRIGLTGATYDDSVRASDPGDLRFLPTDATLNEQAEAAASRRRRFRCRRGPRHPRTGLSDLSRPRSRSPSHWPHPRSVHRV